MRFYPRHGIPGRCRSRRGAAAQGKASMHSYKRSEARSAPSRCTKGRAPSQALRPLLVTDQRAARPYQTSRSQRVGGEEICWSGVEGHAGNAHGTALGQIESLAQRTGVPAGDVKREFRTVSIQSEAGIKPGLQHST